MGGQPSAAPPGSAPARHRPLTGPGRPAARPGGAYEPAPPVRQGPAGLEVDFCGEDGRTRTFAFAELPLPGLHADLVAAFATRLGPTGELRTRAAAGTEWVLLRQFLLALASLPHPPRDITELTPQHLRRYALHRASSCGQRRIHAELRRLRVLLGKVDPRDRLRPDLVAELEQRRVLGPDSGGRPGYSEQEFQRIMVAARCDVAAIRDRLRAGERRAALALAATLPQPLDHAQAELAEIARTGVVPTRGLTDRGFPDWPATIASASRLFLVDADLAPLLVLGVGVTGRNVETLKELPVSHQVLDGRVVALEVVKRRRGPGRSRQTVHWEIGRPSRQLHTPGGYYPLLQELTRRSRSFSGSSTIWSIWAARSGHISPFASLLGRKLNLDRWARLHDLRGDDDQPLSLHLGRLKTTVEVRTTKAAGGHLPSAVRTNTIDVLFRHYESGPPTRSPPRWPTPNSRPTARTCASLPVRSSRSATTRPRRPAASRSAPPPPGRPWTATWTPCSPPAWTTSTAPSRTAQAPAGCRCCGACGARTRWLPTSTSRGCWRCWTTWRLPGRRWTWTPGGVGTATPGC